MKEGVTDREFQYPGEGLIFFFLTWNMAGDGWKNPECWERNSSAAARVKPDCFVDTILSSSSLPWTSLLLVYMTLPLSLAFALILILPSHSKREKKSQVWCQEAEGFASKDEHFLSDIRDAQIPKN